MIPPEPGPDPPEPSILALTYDSIVNWSGSDVVYGGIRDDGVLCEVITTYNPAVYGFSDLYFNGTKYFPAQFNDNRTSVIYFDGTAVKWRNSSGSGGTTQGGITVTSQDPSGYLDALAQGKDVGFTLEAFE